MVVPLEDGRGGHQSSSLRRGIATKSNPSRFRGAQTASRRSTHAEASVIRMTTRLALRSTLSTCSRA
jgi:hypothetical protein